MKINTNLIATFLMALFAINSQAQLAKGNILVGGNLNGGYSDFTKLNVSSKGNKWIDIRPQIGYSLSKSFVVGIELPMKYQIESNSQNESVYRTSGLGIFIRNYKLISPKVSIWLHSSILQTNTSREFNRWSGFPGTSPFEFDLKVQSASITPGMAYSLFKKFQLELSLSELLSFNKTLLIQYTGNFQPNTVQNYTTSYFSLPILSRITLGCRFIFNHPKFK